jgi:sec-independent protein translocase protein TatB
MGNIGGGEILVILLVALIFLGPEKLPEVARQIGKVMGEVRKISNGFQREIQEAMRVPDDPKPAESPSISSEPPVDNVVIEAAAATVLADEAATDRPSATETPSAETLSVETPLTTDPPSVEMPATEPPATGPTADEPPAVGSNGIAPVEANGTAPVAGPSIAGPSIADIVTPPEAPPLPTDVALGGDR